MSAWNYDELKRHIGHTIECVAYGDINDPANVAIECTDCNEVLFDYDRDDDSEIAIIWRIEDVLSIRPDLSDEQCMDILKQIKAKHDATEGVTWDTISYWANELYPIGD